MIDEDEVWDGDDYVNRLEKGDRLFTDNNERTSFDKVNGYAYQGYKSTSSFYGYALAYKKAADKLVQSLENSPIGFNDSLALPIVFLYRHYLELLLKDLIREGNRILGNPPDPDLPKTHDINKLWQKLKPILIQGYKPHIPNVLEMEAVEGCVAEFAAIDIDSQAFRYPIDKKGNSLRNKPYLQNVSYINLQHLAEKMAGIDGFLCESDMMLLTQPSRANSIS